MRNNSMETTRSSDDRLDLFVGGMSQAVCRVYARWADFHAEGSQLTGTLTGPTCLYGETLPATSRFLDKGPGGPPLAEATVPEPSFWTPQMPQLFQARVQLRHGDQLQAEVTRSFGIRPLGAAGARLRLDGKAWVLRGVMGDDVAAEELPAWHDSDTALVVRSPSDILCEAASRIGVLIVAVLDESNVNEIRRLSRWPAVGIVSLPAGASPKIANLGHNLLLAERFAAGQSIDVAAWADVVICEVDDPSGFGVAQVTKPVLACRPLHAASNVNRRAGCDRLQGDLAPRGQFAGYIV
jgi:hypothetical protein